MVSCVLFLFVAKFLTMVQCWDMTLGLTLYFKYKSRSQIARKWNSGGIEMDPLFDGFTHYASRHFAHNFPPQRPTGLARIQWKIVSAGIICDTIFWGVCFFCCCFILEFVHFRLYYVVRPSCYFPRNLAESMCMCFVHFQVNKMFSAGKNSIWELFS